MFNQNNVKTTRDDVTEALEKYQNFIRYEVLGRPGDLLYDLTVDAVDSLPDLATVDSREKLVAYKESLMSWFADRADEIGARLEDALGTVGFSFGDELREEAGDWAKLRSLQELSETEVERSDEEFEESNRPDLTFWSDELPPTHAELERLDEIKNHALDLVSEASRLIAAIDGRPSIY